MNVMLFVRRILTGFLALFLMGTAYGATIEESIHGLAAKSLADKIIAVEALSESGDERARDIL